MPQCDVAFRAQEVQNAITEDFEIHVLFSLTAHALHIACQICRFRVIGISRNTWQSVESQDFSDARPKHPTPTLLGGMQ